MIQIFSAYLNPESGKCVAWVQTGVGIVSATAYGQAEAIVQLLLSGKIAGITVQQDVFDEVKA